MKPLLTLLLAFTVFASTGCNYEDNTQTAIKWLCTHKKPIRCELNSETLVGDKEYTFIDATGDIYTTGLTRLNLPNLYDSTAVIHKP